MTPPRGFHGRRTDGRKDERTEGRQDPAPAPAAARLEPPLRLRLGSRLPRLRPETPPAPRAPTAPGAGDGAGGRGERAAGAGTPAAPLGGAAPARRLLSSSSPLRPPSPPSSPPLSSPPRQSGCSAVRGGLGARVRVPRAGHIPGRRRGAARLPERPSPASAEGRGGTGALCRLRGRRAACRAGAVRRRRTRVLQAHRDGSPTFLGLCRARLAQPSRDSSFRQLCRFSTPSEQELDETCKGEPSAERRELGRRSAAAACAADGRMVTGCRPRGASSNPGRSGQ